MPTNPCPSCGHQGKGVGAVTLESLLTADALAEAGSLDGYRHCPAPGCDVAYYEGDGGRTLNKDCVAVRIGTKETEGPRPVCYCFDHSWESIEDELVQFGSTDAVETITAHCKAGDDRCPEMNPQGSCCLGNVRRAVKESKRKLGIVDPPQAQPATACCADDDGEDAGIEAPKPESIERPLGSAGVASAGSLAAGGAVLTALLSSACCWLPLLLIAVGAGTSSVAGFFEAYRLPLLAGTFGLLGVSFYLVYVRKPACAPGSACEVPNPRLRRFNKASLWTATGLVAAFAFFPSYVGDLLSVGDGPRAAVTGVRSVGAAHTRVVDVDVEGMTCESCTSHIKTAVANLPGVTTLGVSYDDKRARFAIDNPSINDAMIIAAIAEGGYRAAPRGAHVRRYDVEGMTCESCVEHLEHALGELSGVRSAAVSYREKLAVVIFHDDKGDDASVLKAVKGAGYKATPNDG